MVLICFLAYFEGVVSPPSLPKGIVPSLKFRESELRRETREGNGGEEEEKESVGGKVNV